MIALEHRRYCAEIVEQTRLMREALGDTDLATRVPSCPEWTLADLVRHVGAAHRWVHVMVRDRATEELPDDQVPHAAGPPEPSPKALGDWLEEGAHLLAEELRAAGPRAPVWSWAGQPHAGFWARRMAHETVVHRADAHLAAAVDFTVDPTLAADTVEEWLELVTFAQQGDDPEVAELRQLAGHAILLHAEDVGVEAGGSWLIEFTEQGFTWSRRSAEAKATVTLRGPIAGVLQVFYRRLPPDTDAVSVLGDPAPLDFWLARVSFG